MEINLARDLKSVPCLVQMNNDYPHIVEQLKPIWTTKAASEYMMGLLSTEREDRTGFDMETWQCIFRTLKFHNESYNIEIKLYNYNCEKEFNANVALEESSHDIPMLGYIRKMG